LCSFTGPLSYVRGSDRRNGTRFVLQSDVFGRIQLWQGAHLDEIGERALEDAVKARLIAVDQLQGRLCGYGGEAIGETGQLVLIGGLGRNRAIHDTGLDGPGAALAPESGKHLLDQAKLDGIGGSEAREELGVEGIKALARFVFKDNALGH
jgi:hypothetical protein